MHFYVLKHFKHSETYASYRKTCDNMLLTFWRNYTKPESQATAKQN